MISPALAANGSNFILGNASNAATAVSRLTANVAGPTLQLWNTKTGPGVAALSLVTSYVSTSAKVTNLNSDKLDGQDSSAFLPVNGTAANPTNAANADELDGTSTFALPDMRGLEPDGVRYFICVSGIYP
jgi:hypothetical protein